MAQKKLKKKQLTLSKRLKKQWVWFSLKNFNRELRKQFPFLTRRPNYFVIGSILILLSGYLQVATVNHKTRPFSKTTLSQAFQNVKPRAIVKKVSASESPEVVTANAEANPTALLTSPRAAVVPVLMYHYIQPSSGRDKLTVDLSVLPDNFEKQMHYLESHSFTTISPQELEDALTGKGELPKKPIILTFDDGYRDFYLNAYPILKKYQLKATNFIPTGLVDKLWYLRSSDIKEMAQDPNITFAGHTINHAQLTSYPNDRAYEEIKTGKRQLEALLGRKVDFFAYPFGAFDNRIIDLVEKAGYKMAFTTIYGATQSLGNIFAEPRVRISGNDSLVTFISKVDHF